MVKHKVKNKLHNNKGYDYGGEDKLDSAVVYQRIIMRNGNHVGNVHNNGNKPQNFPQAVKAAFVHQPTDFLCDKGKKNQKNRQYAPFQKKSPVVKVLNSVVVFGVCLQKVAEKPYG